MMLDTARRTAFGEEHELFREAVAMPTAEEVAA